MSNISFEDLNVKKCSFLQFKQDLILKTLTLAGAAYEEELGTDSEYFQTARQPICAIGNPGIGKTAVIKSAIDIVNAECERLGIKVKDEYWHTKEKDIAENNVNPNDAAAVEEIRPYVHFGFKEVKLAQTNPGDLERMPVTNITTGEVTEYTIDRIPVADRDGEYGVLFFDEITSAMVEQVQPVLGLADSSRMLSGQRIPEHWLVVAAGNGPECGNFVSLDQMTIDRFLPLYYIDYTLEDWEDNASRIRPDGTNRTIMHPQIRAYLEIMPQDIVEEAGEGACASPRSWEALSNQLYMMEGSKKINPNLSRYANNLMENKVKFDPTEDRFITLVCNTIGVSVGAHFLAYLSLASTDYNPKAILEGKEKKFDIDGQGSGKDGETKALNEVIATGVMLIESCCELVAQKLRTYVTKCENSGMTDMGDIKESFEERILNQGGDLAKDAQDILTMVGNMFIWFLNIDSLDIKMNFVRMARKSLVVDTESFYVALTDNISSKANDCLLDFISENGDCISAVWGDFSA